MNSGVFGSVTHDCEAINKGTNTHSEKIKTIENTMDIDRESKNSIRDYLNYGMWNIKWNTFTSNNRLNIVGSNAIFNQVWRFIK